MDIAILKPWPGVSAERLSTNVRIPKPNASPQREAWGASVLEEAAGGTTATGAEAAGAGGGLRPVATNFPKTGGAVRPGPGDRSVE